MFNRTMRRGFLIIFEGLDRSGKSTQAELLTKSLNNDQIKSEYWKYPKRDTQIGKLINSYLNKEIELNDQAVHLMFSANRWDMIEQMKSKLNEGISLIIDRYAYSGVAYTAAKPNMDFEWCKQCDIGLPRPDLVCFMDTRLAEINSRDGFGAERYENVDFQQLVYENFKMLFDLDKKENRTHNEQLIIDAKGSIQSIHQQIRNHVIDLIKNNPKNIDEFKYLW